MFAINSLSVVLTNVLDGLTEAKAGTPLETLPYLGLAAQDGYPLTRLRRPVYIKSAGPAGAGARRVLNRSTQYFILRVDSRAHAEGRIIGFRRRQEREAVRTAIASRVSARNRPALPSREESYLVFLGAAHLAVQSVEAGGCPKRV